MTSNTPNVDSFAALDDTSLAEACLGNWHQLNAVLDALGSKELARLIRLELAGKRRAYFIRRLHLRLTRLRVNTEAAAIKEATALAKKGEWELIENLQLLKFLHLPPRDEFGT